MTNEEVIDILKIAKSDIEWNYPMNYQEALDLAIKQIKKQIPKKPIYDKWIYSEYWYCPNCNEVVLAKLKDIPIENEYNHSHCGGCGQALDWND